MKLKLEFGECFCYTPVFNINGVNADTDDFGEQYDRSSETAEPYCCGDMRFTRKYSTAEVLRKYNINESEYELIAEKLEIGLSFGSCGWCQ